MCRLRGRFIGEAERVLCAVLFLSLRHRGIAAGSIDVLNVYRCGRKIRQTGSQFIEQVAEDFGGVDADLGG